MSKTIEDLKKIFDQLTKKEKEIVNSLLKKLFQNINFKTKKNDKTTIKETECYSKNYSNAFNYCKEKIQKEKFLNVKIIKITFALYKLNENTKYENFRKDLARIGNLKNFKLVKSPHIENHINNFINNFNDLKNKNNLLNKSFLLHHYFEIIHPFDDGNGRMGRLLMIIFWQKFQLWPKKISCPFDYTVKLEKKNYIEGLKNLSEQLIIKKINEKLIEEVSNGFDYSTFLEKYQIPIEFYLKKMKYLYQKNILNTYNFIKDFQSKKEKFKQKKLI